MTRQLDFDREDEFVEALTELVKSGVPTDALEVGTPHPVHEAEKMLSPRPSWLKLFSYVGALSGCLLGYGLTIYTALRYPLISGGKYRVTILPYTIIAFELTILIGALLSFAGLLLLGRLPEIRAITSDRPQGKRFWIHVKE